MIAEAGGKAENCTFFPIPFCEKMKVFKITVQKKGTELD